MATVSSPTPRTPGHRPWIALALWATITAFCGLAVLAFGHATVVGMLGVPGPRFSEQVSLILLSIALKSTIEWSWKQAIDLVRGFRGDGPRDRPGS
jgi:hypothetical protein